MNFVIDRTSTSPFVFEDLTRNESNLKEIADILAVPFTEKEWQQGEPPFDTDFAKWETALAGIVAVYGSLENISTKLYNDYSKWNNTESILKDIVRRMNDAEQVAIYCGEDNYSGDYLI